MVIDYKTLERLKMFNDKITVSDKIETNFCLTIFENLSGKEDQNSRPCPECRILILRSVVWFER